MNKLKGVLILILVFYVYSIDSRAQEIPPAPEGKSVVYFVRSSSLGLAINFSYFDSAALIGRFNGPKYIRYECDPGPHLFWARSENKSFIEAQLDAGKIYFIHAVPKMGAIKAGVRLEPVNPTDQKQMETIKKLMRKKPAESFSKEQLQAETNELNDVIQRGLVKYKEDHAKGNKNPKLEASMSYQ